MDVDFLPSLQKSISMDRRQAYKAVRDTDLDLLAKYAWNIQLTEALYPSVHVFEIVFRNSLHEAIADHLGNPHWLTSHCQLLRPKEQQSVADVENNLRQMGRALTPGRIVAELTLGFWVGLMYSAYNGVFWPILYPKVFPNCPKNLLKRRILVERVDGIKSLRNRLFHHERISHLPDLADRHHNLIEAVNWISQPTGKLLSEIDCFQDVLEPDFYRDLRIRLSKNL